MERRETDDDGGEDDDGGDDDSDDDDEMMAAGVVDRAFALLLNKREQNLHLEQTEQTKISDRRNNLRCFSSEERSLTLYRKS